MHQIKAGISITHLANNGARQERKEVTLLSLSAPTKCKNILFLDFKNL